MASPSLLKGIAPLRLAKQNVSNGTPARRRVPLLWHSYPHYSHALSQPREHHLRPISWIYLNRKHGHHSSFCRHCHSVRSCIKVPVFASTDHLDADAPLARARSPIVAHARPIADAVMMIPMCYLQASTSALCPRLVSLRGSARAGTLLRGSLLLALHAASTASISRP